MKDAAFLEALREEYTTKFPYEWVAVFEGRIIGPSKDDQALLDLLREKEIDPMDAGFAMLDPAYRRTMLL